MAESGRKPARSRSAAKKSLAGRPAANGASVAPATEVPSTEGNASSADIAALARRAAELCAEYRANDVVMLNLRGVTDMTDFFIVASGTSDTHVRSVGEHVVEEMRKSGARAHHVEGLTQGRWVLLDFVDFVVHLFHPTLREFYQLERLWSDAEVIPIAVQGAGA
jgi:ribosome-associated protein